jgi:deoxyribodipyrimidine photo-lyase
MYVASLVCNIAQSHWLMPSRWMYYHLLDGDFASNAGSWQWVAGSGSSKKYYANQENINRYTFTLQTGTYLDCSYEALVKMNVPEQLKETQDLILQTELPSGNRIVIDPNTPTFIYNYYNLDPIWHANEKGNRILLLEPEHFQQYPVSKKCIDFMMGLSANIPDLQIFIGSFQSLQTNYQHQSIHFKEHPLNKGYTGIEESRDWICEEVSGYYPSFFSYWKKTESQLAKKYKHSNT